MTTRHRIDLLARACPRAFPRASLHRLVRAQLGSIDALDGWKGGHLRRRARAPQVIYHLCAGNLAVSACASLMHGLLLGSRNIVKLPSVRDDDSTRRGIIGFVRGLPRPLRDLVEIENELDPASLARAEVVVAFGSDATMDTIRARLSSQQRFIAHGHAVSLLDVANPAAFDARMARACAVDVLTYDQLGCLSPQAILVPDRKHLRDIGDRLARALESQWRRQAVHPRRPLGVAARIVEARDVAHALGHRIWQPEHLGWTIIADYEGVFVPSPLHGVIFLRAVADRALAAHLAPVAGKLSTIGCAGKRSSRRTAAFLRLGVSRFCPAGHMQFPPLTWHHDGRPPLTDLVTWTEDET